VRAIASALGPVIGGALTSRVTWRWCFYLNLPTGGVAFMVLLFLLPLDPRKSTLLEGLKAIDWLGTIFLTGGVITFVLGLQFGGSDYSWSSPTVICLLAFGIIIGAFALVIEGKVAKFPVMPLSIFGSRHNASALLICFSHSAVFFAGSYYLPLYFQGVLLASPLWSGVYLLPMVLSLAVSSIGAGFIIKRTGRYREIIIAGLVLFTLGYGLFIDLGPIISWPRIIIYQLISGFGTGPLAQAPLVALQANIPPLEMATATAAFGFIRQLSAALSVVLGAVIFQNLWSKQLSSLISVLGDKNATVLEHPVAGFEKNIANLAAGERFIVLQAFSFSLSRVWIFYSVLAGCGALSSLWLRAIVLSKDRKTADVKQDEPERA
jgi:MFS family permease